MQVVHLNPVYDLQLLQMFPDGLDELEAQVAAMADRVFAIEDGHVVPLDHPVA